MRQGDLKGQISAGGEPFLMKFYAIKLRSSVEGTVDTLLGYLRLRRILFQF